MVVAITENKAGWAGHCSVDDRGWTDAEELRVEPCR
jgi:hypothetical protein